MNEFENKNEQNEFTGLNEAAPSNGTNEQANDTPVSPAAVPSENTAAPMSEFSDTNTQSGYTNNPYGYPYPPQQTVSPQAEEASAGQGFDVEKYPPYGYAELYHDTDAKPQKKEKKEKKNGKKAGIIAAVVASIVILSFAAGVAGSAVSPYLFGTQEKTVTQTSDKIAQSSNENTNLSANSGTSSIAAVTKAVADSVVEITTETVTTGNFMQQYISKGAGSGVIMSADGYIVTNNHVIENANKITVKTRAGKEYTAKLVGTDSKTDLAVLKIDASDLVVANAGKSSELVVGQTAIAIGNPLGSLGGTVTSGIISALDREITIDGQTMTLLQTSAAINPGNSGGGLFDENGKLVGIVNAKSSGEDVEGLGFAIPIDIAVPVINSIIKNGYVTGRPALGVSLVNISDNSTAMQYHVSTMGVYIYSISANSAAYTAGLKPGDRIVSVNGKEVETSSEVSAIVDRSKVGDSLKIVYERDGQKGEVTAVLLESKS